MQTKDEAFQLFLNRQQISMKYLWDAACAWQKDQDISIAKGKYLVDSTKEADDIAYDNAITDVINSIRKGK